MPVQRLKRETTSLEFIQWKVFLEKEANEFHREDYYLAQIAREVRAVLSRDPGKLKISNFLLEFQDRNNPDDGKSQKQRTQDSKNFWFAVAGVPRKPPEKEN